MLAAYLTGRLNRLAAEWDERRARLTTPAALEERNAFIRRTVVEMVGGFPARQPFAARIVKTIERPGYRVENVMFQSRPDFWVTANLYVPTSAGPHPGIISPCGHYALARMLPSYQLAYQSLVRAGFVVLAFDPIGQGERRQYWNPETNVSEGNATTEHSMVGQVQILLGETLTGYRMWDAMRAIDYLVSRPEVDSARIGCTGHSGGGTLTLFTSAVDERIRCAVVHQGGTRARWPIHLQPMAPLGPSDVEQNLFPAATHGIDLPDLHIAIGPRPLLATIEHRSPEFDAAVERIRRGFTVLGHADRFAALAAGDPHAWTYKLRLATVDWFSRWFLQRPGPTTEAALTPESPEDLRCTPNGSLLYSKQGQTVWTLAAAATRNARRSAPPAADLRRLLRLDRRERPPLDPRHVETVPREGYAIDQLTFLSEPGIYLPVWVFQPPERRPGAPAILYFNEAGKDADGMEFESAEAAGLRYGVLATLARRGYQVIAADVRGIGETRTPHRSSSGNPFSHLFDTDTAFTYMTWFMDDSLLGMRVHDVLRTVEYALSRPDTRDAGVCVVGKEMAATLVRYAAHLDPRIRATVSHRGLSSYAALTESDRYLHGAAIMLPRALRTFDLPQLGEGRVRELAPVGAMKRPLPGTLTEEPDLAAQYVRLLGL